mgnify:CR=1 FL=1
MTGLSTQPPPPVGCEFTSMWRTGPAAAPIAIEIWGRREHRTAVLRIHDADDGYMDAGDLVGGGTDDAAVDWTEKAHELYGADWLDAQEREAVRTLANRWGTV